VATLNIRRFPDEAHAALRLRAAQNRRSMEAEARAILLEQLAQRPKPRLTPAEAQARIREMFGGELPTGVVDSFLKERRRMWGEEEDDA
jgi:plasmid stability protein